MPKMTASGRIDRCLQFAKVSMILYICGGAAPVRRDSQNVKARTVHTPGPPPTTSVERASPFASLTEVASPDIPDRRLKPILVARRNQQIQRGLEDVMQRRFSISRMLERTHDVSPAIDFVHRMQARRICARRRRQHARQFPGDSVVSPQEVVDVPIAVIADNVRAKLLR